MKENKRLLSEILKLARLIVVAALIAGIFFYVKTTFFKPAEPQITSSFVSGKLESVSELTTSKLIYTGLIRYCEGNIPFLTKNSFSMLYTATIRAGMDLSQAKIEITETEVVITLPECTLQSVDVDMDSIEFYDEHMALFNWSEKKDVIDTVAAAKADVTRKADIESLLQEAARQSETMVKGILSDVIKDKTLVII